VGPQPSASGYYRATAGGPPVFDPGDDVLVPWSRRGGPWVPGGGGGGGGPTMGIRSIETYADYTIIETVEVVVVVVVRAVFVGGVGGLNPPRKVLTPLLLLKNARGSTFYVPMH